MMQCECGKNYNFYVNGNANATNIMVISPNNTDLVKGRILTEGSPEAIAYRTEFLKAGMNLYTDFLILPTHYHPNPKKACYNHAIITLLQATKTRPNVLFVGSDLFTQVRKISEMTLHDGYLVPAYDDVLGVKYVIISTIDKLGELQLGLRRFKEMINGGVK